MIELGLGELDKSGIAELTFRGRGRAAKARGARKAKAKAARGAVKKAVITQLHPAGVKTRTRAAAARKSGKPSKSTARKGKRG
jgi:ribosomal protein S19E (S16A)